MAFDDLSRNNMSMILPKKTRKRVHIILCTPSSSTPPFYNIVLYTVLYSIVYTLLFCTPSHVHHHFVHHRVIHHHLRTSVHHRLYTTVLYTTGSYTITCTPLFRAPSLVKECWLTSLEKKSIRKGEKKKQKGKKREGKIKQKGQGRS